MYPSCKKLHVLKPATFIVVLICLIYANTLNFPWHLDDFRNITENSKVQMDTLNKVSIKNSLYGTPTRDSLYRPISNLSFALNWLWGKDEVTGYRVINIAIHIMNAFLLYLTLLQLFQTPNAGEWTSYNIYFIALLSTVLWAIHPIQIQAVTYIVQRMASLAAMFYLMGILCYLKARMSSFKLSRVMFWGLCCLSFLLGVGSKNNAILLPISLLLIEFIFFQDLSVKSVRKKALIVIILTGLLIASAGVFLFLEKGLIGFLTGYETRPFSMLERLLTQPVILLFYLTQIFYPVASRFSIAHDVTYASSLFQPWYTFFAIITIIMFIGLALWRIRKNPFLSFAILFYFTNHLIESSILPLEMIFEHRNYLPSFFLFVPIAMGIKYLLDHYNTNKKTIYHLLVFFVSALMIGLGISTYIRNWDWHSTKTLWQDAAKKAPLSARPLHNLAYGYYEPSGQYDKAIDLYEKALQLRQNRTVYKAITYYNIAAIYYSILDDPAKTIDQAQKALDIFPQGSTVRMLLCDAHSTLGQYEEAIIQLDVLLEDNSSFPKAHHQKGFILMKTNQLEKALPHFQQSIRLSPNDWKYLRDLGMCLTLMKHHERGIWFLNRSLRLNPRQVSTILALADNRLRTGSHDDASKYISKLVGLIGIEQIETLFDEIEKDPLGLPLDLNNLKKLTASHIQDLTNSYEQTATHMLLQSETGM